VNRRESNTTAAGLPQGSGTRERGTPTMSSIVTNVSALNAQRNLGISGMKLGKVLEKLSSGYRINRAADDAAGLGISEKMRAQIRGNSQAIRNAQDGISMLQTAEGAMDEIHGMLQRMRELSVQAANDTYDAAARTSIGQELFQLRSEIDRIAGGTTFNGQSLLTGSLSGTLGGATATDVVTGDAVGAANVVSVNVSSAKAGTYTFTGTGTSLTLTGPNGQAQQITVSNIAANSTGNLDFNQLGISISLVSAAGETGANLVTAFIAAANDTIVVTGSGSAKIQVGANATANDTLNISFSDVQASTATGLDLNSAGSVDWTSTATIVASNTAAQAVINQLDGAITALNTARSTLGASANRLEHSVASLGVAVENLTASESRVRDADIAALSSKMASFQILQQAGTSVLAQANQSAQSVLNLLR
jgi:flagellin